LFTGKKRYQLLVLEEFNIALRDGFINVKDVLDIINKYYDISDIIITGRCAPKTLIARADLVTEMKEIKHPFRKGIKSRKGIEF